MDKYEYNNGVKPVSGCFRLSTDENGASCRVTPVDEKQIKAEHYGN